MGSLRLLFIIETAVAENGEYTVCFDARGRCKAPKKLGCIFVGKVTAKDYLDFRSRRLVA
jgi:hypothetical protein